MPDNNLELRLSILGLGIVTALRAVRRAIQAVTDAAGEQQRALAAVAQRIEGLGNATELSTPSLARMAWRQIKLFWRCEERRRMRPPSWLATGSTP